MHAKIILKTEYYLPSIYHNPKENRKLLFSSYKSFVLQEKVLK